MFLKLDGEGPLYRQLTRALRAAMLDGRFVDGGQLPATRVLAQDLGVSRNTVRAAYDQLIAEGFFHGRSGSGSYIIQTSPTQTRVKAMGAERAQSLFSRRVRAIKDFDIGRLHYGLRFNLQYGEPIHDPRAISAWRRELSHAAARTSPNYPSMQGDASLRQAICEYLARRRGTVCSASDVLIVSGTQQALSLTAQVLVNSGDAVVLEDPHYFSARHVFTGHGARMSAIRTDADGLICSALPKRPPKLIVVTPSHQFPGGSLMSIPRRIELLNYAVKKRCWVFEDDYDSEFRYDAQPMPALRSLDVTDRVIYAGSFSKVMFPALRLGYIVVPEALRKDFVSAKRLADMGCAGIEQAAMARFISGGGFERHLRRIVQIARRRRRALLDGLVRVGRGLFEVQDSHAGMHVVAWLPSISHAQCAKLIALANARGLGLHPIAAHFHRMPKIPGLLLGYASLSAIEIDAAMLVLEASLSALFDRQPRRH